MRTHYNKLNLIAKDSNDKSVLVFTKDKFNKKAINMIHENFINNMVLI